jgi:hypothetical protein
MLQIDFEYLKKARKSNILPEDAIILYILYNKEFKEIEEWVFPIALPKLLKYYEEQGFIKITGENPLEDLEFRESFTTLVTPINSKINFDEFWDAFPQSTKSGRVLRALNKTNLQGKHTRDYDVCKKKYLSKVKSEELHEQIVATLKKRVELNEYEYINGIEVYINQSKWERDIAILNRINEKENFSKDV